MQFIVAKYTDDRRKFCNNNPKPIKTKEIKFVKKGEKATHTETETRCIWTVHQTGDFSSIWTEG